MVASLNRPVVTDYHPILNRPIFLLLILVLMAAAVARDLTAAAVLVAAAGLGTLVLWLAESGLRSSDEPAEDLVPPG